MSTTGFSQHGDTTQEFVVPKYFRLSDSGLLLYKLPNPDPTPVSIPYPTRGPVLVLTVDWEASGGPLVATDNADVSSQIIYNRQWRDTKTGEDKVFNEVLSWQGGVGDSCLYYGGKEATGYSSYLPDGTLVDYVYQVIGDLTRYTNYYTPVGLAVDGVAVTDINSVTGAGIYLMPEAEFLSWGGSSSLVVDGFVPVIRFLSIGGTGNDFIRWGMRPLQSPTTVLAYNQAFTPDLYSDVVGNGSVAKFNSLGTKAVVVTVTPGVHSSPEDRVFELNFATATATAVWQREFGGPTDYDSSDSTSGGIRTQSSLETHSRTDIDSPAADYVADAVVVLALEVGFSYETSILITDDLGSGDHSSIATTTISQSLTLKEGSSSLFSVSPIVTSLTATGAHEAAGDYVRTVVGDWANLGGRVIFADIPNGLYILVVILREADTALTTWTSPVYDGFGGAVTEDTLHITYTVYVIKGGTTILSSVLHSFDFYPSSVGSLDCDNPVEGLIIAPATSTFVESWVDGLDADACVFTDSNGTESIAVSITSRMEYPDYPDGAPYHAHKTNISKVFRYHESAWQSCDFPDPSAYYAHMVYGDYT